MQSSNRADRSINNCTTTYRLMLEAVCQLWRGGSLTSSQMVSGPAPQFHLSISFYSFYYSCGKQTLSQRLACRTFTWDQHLQKREVRRIRQREEMKCYIVLTKVPAELQRLSNGYHSEFFQDRKGFCLYAHSHLLVTRSWGMTLMHNFLYRGKTKEGLRAEAVIW